MQDMYKFLKSAIRTAATDLVDQDVSEGVRRHRLDLLAELDTVLDVAKVVDGELTAHCECALCKAMPTLTQDN